MPPHESLREGAAGRPASGLIPAAIGRNWLAILKVAIAGACLVPFAIAVAKVFALIPVGANPVEELLHSMGKTGLNLLWITLAVTPARKLTKWNWLIRLRRMLGLFAFFYLVLHLVTYAVLDRGLDFQSLLVDVTERPYITAGMLGLLLLIPLAVTSTRGWQRRLGRNWSRLHRLVYPAAMLGVVHFWWQVKADFREPLVYAVLLALLLGYRLADSRMRAHRRRSALAAQ